MIMQARISYNDLKGYCRSIREPLERFLLIIDAVGWLIITGIFFLAAILAFAKPDLFTQFSDGVAFLGLSFATFMAFLYVVDKIQDKNKSVELNTRLQNIETMVKKWDFE